MAGVCGGGGVFAAAEETYRMISGGSFGGLGALGLVAQGETAVFDTVQYFTRARGGVIGEYEECQGVTGTERGVCELSLRYFTSGRAKGELKWNMMKMKDLGM